MTEPRRVESRCDGCGATDDHPKHHYGTQTFHHDCTPAFVLDDMTSVSTYVSDAQGNIALVSRTPIPEDDWHPGVKRFMAIRDVAMKGTRGPKLLAHIQRMHEDVRQDPEGLGLKAQEN